MGRRGSSARGVLVSDYPNFTRGADAETAGGVDSAWGAAALERVAATRAKSLWEKACSLVAPRGLVLHLTAQSEVEETRARFPRAAVRLIPNGVEIAQTLHREPRGARLRLGFVGRLDPKKGIENLLAACRILKERGGPAFSLAIAGSGSSDYEARLRREIDRLDLSNKVAMLGDIRGEEKQRMFERTDVVVAPSFTENFAIVVAEALAHGAAVIASHGTPWKEVERMGCGLWVGNDPASLADAISTISSMPVAEMGERGRRWMGTTFHGKNPPRKCWRSTKTCWRSQALGGSPPRINCKSI